MPCGENVITAAAASLGFEDLTEIVQEESEERWSRVGVQAGGGNPEAPGGT